jgi:hypothetical protein
MEQKLREIIITRRKGSVSRATIRKAIKYAASLRPPGVDPTIPINNPQPRPAPKK